MSEPFEYAVARAERLAAVIAAGLVCPRCKRHVGIQSGGMFLPGPYCDHCHSGIVPTEEWKEAMRALSADPNSCPSCAEKHARIERLEEENARLSARGQEVPASGATGSIAATNETAAVDGLERLRERQAFGKTASQ